MPEANLMDRVAIAIIEQIGSLGYEIIVGENDLVATDEEIGEVFAVRASTLYAAAVELAEQVGVDLDCNIV